MIYKISERGINFRKNIFICMIIFTSIIGLISGTLIILKSQNNFISSIITISIFFIFISLFLFFSLKIFLKTIEKNIKSIYYIIENDHFIIKQNDHDRISISKEEVKNINQYINNVHTVILNNNKKIVLNRYLENYDDFISRLKSSYSFNYINKKYSDIISILIIIFGIIFIFIYLYFRIGKLFL
jgi:TRAP-type C4-dicarboxylate transport system permease small subunit